jgi:thiosulfate/3-mercaptopyruvate sulfurtransferase
VSAVSVLWLKYGNGISEKITHNPTKYKIMKNPIVSVDWLHEHLQDPELIILDAILETPIGDIQIKVEPLTSKPSLAILIVRCPILYQTRKPLRQPAVIKGIHNGSKIVVYDTKGIYSSPRVVAFKVMGHEKVWYSMAACLLG